MKVIVKQRVLCFLSVYAQQCSLGNTVKGLFYDQLNAVIEMIPVSKFLIPCGDWDIHVGSTDPGHRKIHEGCG